jgi:hypothetical protein
MSQANELTSSICKQGRIKPLFYARSALHFPRGRHRGSAPLSLSERGLPLARAARAARYRCVFPPPSALPRSSSSAPADRQCTDRGGHNLTALAIDYLLATRRATLGLLNPWLYRGGLLAINDITSGSKPGFSELEIAGWDPVRPREGLVSLSHSMFNLNLKGDE